MNPDVAAAIRALVEAVLYDEHHSGGLLSRETLCKAYALVVVIEDEAKRKKAP